MEMPNKKMYLGDSVFVSIDHGMLKLTTENGNVAYNTVMLEPEVWEALVLYVEREWISYSP